MTRPFFVEFVKVPKANRLNDCKTALVLVFWTLIGMYRKLDQINRSKLMLPHLVRQKGGSRKFFTLYQKSPARAENIQMFTHPPTRARLARSYTSH